MEKPNLISLEDWNSKRTTIYEKKKQPQHNGIACPKCGHELIDTNPDLTLTSWPLQKRVRCLLCNWAGTRIA